ncbi:hypothetical protein GGS26DRAFT_426660 [Hypomontagnella submonticulosa]|nr:hypothetical protein GGS26DRAFT_426660 [Hypomontagnella submonticulosa]
MYRRKSNKFHKLDRRKSVSSTKSVQLEHIHPEIAERDAHAAATQAFARARERSATDTTLWPPPRSNASTGTGGYNGSPDRRSDSSAVRRQQSVRFVRTRTTQNHTIVEETMPGTNRNIQQANVASNGIGCRPTSRASAAGMVSAAKGTAGDYINALLTGEEYYTPEDDIASAPSSYRRIRKSRSMFTSSEASMTSRNYVEVSNSVAMNQPDPSPVSSSSLVLDENVPKAGLKAPKSMTFLSSRRDQSMLFSKRRGSVPLGPSNGESTRTPSNKGVPMKSQSSVFLRPKPASADKFLRRSMRDDSNDTLPIDAKIPKDGSLRNRARKVSHNFKHKLKSFFNMVKGDADDTEFPPQQIVASKSHNTDLGSSEYMRDDESQFDPVGEEAALSRVPSGIPSLHAVPSHQQLRSRQGSVKSLRSERRGSDERSRVTSWTNSDTNTINTMNSHKGEWDRQRLSVIKENGTHISSSSARPGNTAQRLMSNTGGHFLPLPMPPQPVTVDSQRIYSALMKKLNDTRKQSQRSEMQRQISVDNFMTTGTVPPRGSSQGHDSGRPGSRATIRHVTSDDFSDSSSVRTTERKLVASIRGVRTEPNETSFRLELESTPERELPQPASTSILREAERFAEGNSQPCPIPRIEEPSPPARTLSTRSSAFFASPTCHLFRTRSPYRRALQDSIRTESQNTHLRSPEFNPWMRSLTGLRIRCPSTCESEADVKMQYAESIYSSTSDEPATGSLNAKTAAATNFSKPLTTHGDATIFVNPPVYRPTPPPAPKHRETSSASSVEWKMWLSANISKLESTSGRADTTVLEYAMPSRPSGHIRENAQINDDDEQPPLEVYKPTRPDSALATIEHNARASPQTARPIRRSTSPIHHYDKENEVPERPATRSRTALRTTPSLASIASAREAKASTEPTRKGTLDSLRWKSLARKPSLNTLAGNPMSASTRRLVKRQSDLKTYATPTPSPRHMPAAKDGSADLKRRFGGEMANNKTENISPNTACGGDADMDPYGAQGSGVFGPGMGTGTELTPQSLGSKKMVDLFLSSRRRRMASSDDAGVFS